jgi:hypothetical protein
MCVPRNLDSACSASTCFAAPTTRLKVLLLSVVCCVVLNFSLAAQTEEQGLSGEAATVKGSLLSTMVQMMMCGDAEVVSAVLSWTLLLTTRSTTDTGEPLMF